jgi:hypothetical protein
MPMERMRIICRVGYLLFFANLVGSLQSRTDLALLVPLIVQAIYEELLCKSKPKKAPDPVSDVVLASSNIQLSMSFNKESLHRYLHAKLSRSVNPAESTVGYQLNRSSMQYFDRHLHSLHFIPYLSPHTSISSRERMSFVCDCAVKAASKKPPLSKERRMNSSSSSLSPSSRHVNLAIKAYDNS